MKFIVAFHANASLWAIQNRLASTSSTTAETVGVFLEAFSNPESKWLRKRRRLRNLLVHYSADPRLTAELSPDATRKDVIEHLGGGLNYDEIDGLLDRHLAQLSRTLETGFNLSGDPFCYGRVT